MCVAFIFIFFFLSFCSFFFFFNDTATTEIYTLSLHDALPILTYALPQYAGDGRLCGVWDVDLDMFSTGDRKSTRLNSSHANISYAVFCLKKKKKKIKVEKKTITL